MAVELSRTDASLREGRLVERINRFVLEVAFEDGHEEVYLPETGRLTTVLVDDATVVCEPASDPDRRTGATALAVHTGAVYVTVEAVRANRLVESAIDSGLLRGFDGWDLTRTEPALPEGGRADLLLDRDGTDHYVEVKAVTHAEDGIGKFPDAPTRRGRRHLRELATIAEGGTPASVVFVAMRPDVSVVRPFREIDPDFAAALTAAEAAGVGVYAIGTAFDPPRWQLVEPTLPVEIH